MRFLFIIFCLCICFKASTQERISALEYEGVSGRYFVQTVDDVNYLLKLTTDDELQVSILNDDFSTIFIRSKVFIGSYYPIIQVPIGNLFYTVDDRDPVIYDFVNDIEIRYTLPEGWFPQSWRNAGSKRMSIGTTNENNSNSKTFIVAEDGSLSESVYDGYGLFSIIDNYLIRGSYTNNSGATNILFAENIDSGQRDTLLSDLDFEEQHRGTLSGNQYLYLNDEGNPCRFSGNDGTVEVIQSIVLVEDEFVDYEWTDSYFLLLKKDNNQNEFIEIYDLAGSQQAAYDLGVSFQAAGELNNPYLLSLDQLWEAEEIGDYLMFGDEDVFVVDLAQDSIHYFKPAGVNYPLSLIDGRYFVSTKININDLDAGWDFYFVDLTDLSETKIEVDSDNRYYSSWYSNIIKVGEDFAGVFWSLNGTSFKSVFKISVDDLTMLHFTEIDDPFIGLPGRETTLFRFDDNLVLASPDIYSVQDDKVEIINTSEIEKIDGYYYQKRRDDLTFATAGDNSISIYSYDGDVLIEEAVIPITENQFGATGYLTDYVVTDDNLFYIFNEPFSADRVLMRYDKGTKTISKVSDSNSFEFVRTIASIDNDAYHIFEGDLYYINKDGVQTKIIEVEDANIGDGVLLTSFDNMYFITSSNLYHLEGENYSILYSDDFDNTPFTAYLNSDHHYKEHSLMLEVFNNNTSYHLYVKDTIVRKVEFDLRISSIRENDGDYFIGLSAHDNDGVRHTYLYSGEEDKKYDLTSLNLGRSVFNLHFVDGIHYAVSKNNISREMYIHKMSDDFSTAELLYTIPNSVGASDAEFEVFGLEGMLYSNDHIFLMETGYTLHEQGVKGTGQTPEMESKDGFVYFVGSDSEYGNQVYRVLLYSFRVSTDDIRPVEKIEVYPNPAFSVLNIPIEISGNYTILNQLGQILAAGELTNNQINISLLNSGLHYLKIENKEEIYITTFLKGE